MTKSNLSRKGQLSFDLAFAVILIVIIASGMIIYFNSSNEALRYPTAAAAATSACQSVASSVSALANSVDSTKTVQVSYATVEIPSDFLSSDPTNIYSAVNSYTLAISGDTISCTSLLSDSQVIMELGFSPCDSAITLIPGDTLVLHWNATSSGRFKCSKLT